MSITTLGEIRLQKVSNVSKFIHYTLRNKNISKFQIILFEKQINYKSVHRSKKCCLVKVSQGEWDAGQRTEKAETEIKVNEAKLRQVPHNFSAASSGSFSFQWFSSAPCFEPDNHLRSSMQH